MIFAVIEMINVLQLLQWYVISELYFKMQPNYFY